MFFDNAELLIKATAYLEKTPAEINLPARNPDNKP
jgi:hypothetical protein